MSTDRQDWNRLVRRQPNEVVSLDWNKVLVKARRNDELYWKWTSDRCCSLFVGYFPNEIDLSLSRLIRSDFWLDVESNKSCEFIRKRKREILFERSLVVETNVEQTFTRRQNNETNEFVRLSIGYWSKMFDLSISFLRGVIDLFHQRKFIESAPHQRFPIVSSVFSRFLSFN